MISRIAVRAMATVAVLGAPVPAMAQSWIQSVAVHADYNAMSVTHDAAPARHLPVIVFDDRRHESTDRIARAVGIAMRGMDGPSPPHAEVMMSPMRVAWSFDDEWWSATDACKRSPGSSLSSAARPAVVRYKLRVTATLCRRDLALKRVVGFTDPNPNPESPVFVAFISDMTSALLPSPQGANARH